MGNNPPRHSKPLPGHPRIASKPARHPNSSQPAHRYGSSTRASAATAERQVARRHRTKLRRLEHQAGRAAPFLVPVGDNSIPTYGSESSDAERQAAETALAAYLRAREAANWSVACANLTTTVQKQVALLSGGAGQPESKGCPAAYAKLSSRIPAAARASVLSGSLTAFRAKGDKAFALFYGPHRQQYMTPMVSEGGIWKVNQLEPITWPLGAPAAGN